MRLAARILSWIVIGMIAMTSLALALMSWLLEPGIHAAQLENLHGIGPTLDRVIRYEPQLLEDSEALAALVGLPVRVLDRAEIADPRLATLRTAGMVSDHERLVLLFALTDDPRVIR
ncbi:MAG: hypothetical protein AAGC55_15665, partial [Myxococcota bacterium]